MWLRGELCGSGVGFSTDSPAWPTSRGSLCSNSSPLGPDASRGSREPLREQAAERHTDLVTRLLLPEYR